MAKKESKKEVAQVKRAKGIQRTDAELAALKVRTGSPPKYDPKYVQEFIDYFSEPPYREVLKKIVTKQGDVVEVPVNEATDFKSLAGFAIKIGVHRDTLHQWAKEFPDFSDVYSRAKDFQENFLTVNGAKTLIQPQFGMFIAKNVTDFKDKREVELSGNVQNLSDEELEKRTKLLEKAIKNS